MNIMNTLVAVAAFAALPIANANAMPVASDLGITAPIMLVAGGCGPGAWRGPWGHCRNTPYSGLSPGGWYQVRAGTGALRATGEALGVTAAILCTTAGCQEVASSKQQPIYKPRSLKRLTSSGDAEVGSDRSEHRPVRRRLHGR